MKWIARFVLQRPPQVKWVTYHGGGKQTGWVDQLMVKNSDVKI